MNLDGPMGWRLTPIQIRVFIVLRVKYINLILYRLTATLRLVIEWDWNTGPLIQTHHHKTQNKSQTKANDLNHFWLIIRKDFPKSKCRRSKSPFDVPKWKFDVVMVVWSISWFVCVVRQWEDHTMNVGNKSYNYKYLVSFLVEYAFIVQHDSVWCCID